MDIAKYFPKIVFEPKEHRYYVDGVEYFSVSSVLEEYTEPFDVETISTRIAQRDGITPEELKLTWEIRRDYSAVRGTEFHLYVEKYLTENRRIRFITNIDHEVEEFHRFWEGKNKEKFEVIATELRICDKEWKLAGTVDCMVRNLEDKKTYLIDWKTNKEIRTKNEFQRFKTPIEHLDDCDFNKYSLQTSLYKAIIHRNTSLSIDGVYLIHFPKDENYQVLTCKNMDREIKELMDQRI